MSTNFLGTDARFPIRHAFPLAVGVRHVQTSAVHLVSVSCAEYEGKVSIVGACHPVFASNFGGRFMRLVLVGPPGSGKGTQAELLTERLGLRYVGTGDLLREAIQRGTPTGKIAEPLLKKGQLV